MGRTRTILTVAGLLAALLLLAACGGDDDGAETLTKEEFIAQADAICADAFEQEEALGPEPQTSEPERYEAWYTDYQAIGQAALVELRALSPPEEDAETIDELLSNYEAAYASVPNRIAAALRGESEGDLAIEEFRLAEVASAAYGFSECLVFGVAGLV